MDAPWLEAEAFVEAVRLLVVCVAVQREDVAVVLPCVGFEVFDQALADTRAARFGIDDEILDFQVFSAPHLGGYPAAADADEGAMREGPGDLIVRVAVQEGGESFVDHWLRYFRVEDAEESGGSGEVGVRERADFDGWHGAAG